MIFNEKIIKALDSSTSLHSVPFTIADDMVNMLDSTDFFKEPDLTITASEYINNHRVIDVSCKSGSLLFSFYKKFMIALRNVFPDRDDRDYFIVRNLLFGLCPSARYLSMLRATFYSNKKYDLSNELGNFYHYDFKNQIGVDNKEVKELLENMKFDVVCGNPPYNDDMYLDFVMLGHRLAKTYDLWITPAKFVTTADDYRAKSDTSYKAFRECILDKISDLCFYPDALDLFNISQVDGIAYYLVCKDSTQTCNIENKSLHNKQYNSYCVRNLVDSRVLFNKGYDLIKKLGKYDSFKPSSLDKNNLYKVIIGTQFVTNGCGSEERKHAKIGSKSNIFNLDGTITVVSKGSINTEVPSGAYCCAFSSDKEIECRSFISWLNTRFMRFLVLCNISKLTGIYTDDYFKFVPNPGSFDKIYEDSPLEGYIPDENGIYTDKDGVVHCSLYVKYKLIDEEINVIESVIRERK